jgi:hypothetical protein
MAFFCHFEDTLYNKTTPEAMRSLKSWGKMTHFASDRCAFFDFAFAATGNLENCRASTSLQEAMISWPLKSSSLHGGNPFLLDNQWLSFGSL